MEPQSPELKEAESANDKLREIIEPLQILLNERGILEKDSALSLDERYHDIKSAFFGFGEFSFWGGLEEEGLYPISDGETAVIKNLRIPKELRKKGLGSQIVGIWEEKLSKKGVKYFAATNIKDKSALEFWTKLGYRVPQSQAHKEIPYVVVKEIPKLL